MALTEVGHHLLQLTPPAPTPGEAAQEPDLILVADGERLLISTELVDLGLAEIPLATYDLTWAYDPTRTGSLRVRMDDPQPRQMLALLPLRTERWQSYRLVGIDHAQAVLPITPALGVGAPTGVFLQYDTGSNAWYLVVDREAVAAPFAVPLVLTSLTYVRPSDGRMAGPFERAGRVWFLGDRT